MDFMSNIASAGIGFLLAFGFLIVYEEAKTKYFNWKRKRHGRK